MNPYAALEILSEAQETVETLGLDSKLAAPLLKSLRDTHMHIAYARMLESSAIEVADENIETLVRKRRDADGGVERTGRSQIPAFGENATTLLGYLLHGPPKNEPDFHKRTKLSLSEKGKTTAIVCYAPKTLKRDNEAVDVELAKALALQFNNHKIRVFDPDRVEVWLDKNPNYSKVTEVAAAFNLDYVVHIDIKDFSLFAAQSSDLYQGRCDAVINVFKMNEDKTDGEPIYTTEFRSRFPSRPEKSVYEISQDEFKNMFLSALSDQIGKKFYESYSSDDVENATLQ
ncbi:MAG: hypothetical protein NT069_04005 [Planctomycetota bacterium]|nr:hypothetical protein [Planctomycetota bacterium]